MTAHLSMTFQNNGLKPGEKYGASIQWETADGGENTGLSDVAADAEGVVRFPVNPALLNAVAQAKGPGTLTLWVRKGEGQFDDPPVEPHAKVVISLI